MAVIVWLLVPLCLLRLASAHLGGSIAEPLKDTPLADVDKSGKTVFNWGSGSRFKYTAWDSASLGRRCSNLKHNSATVQDWGTGPWFLMDTATPPNSAGKEVVSPWKVLGLNRLSHPPRMSRRAAAEVPSSISRHHDHQ